MELTAYQVQQMKEQKEKFYLLNEEPECTNVIFWYVPERLRPRQCPQYGTRDWQLELGNVSVVATMIATEITRVIRYRRHLYKGQLDRLEKFTNQGVPCKRYYVKFAEFNINITLINHFR